MRNFCLLCVFIVLSGFPLFLAAQQHVAVVSRCGGMDTVIIPTIIDNDHDGMDDGLELRLLNHFMPTMLQFSDESCPGPALDGTGDSNLVVSHIYPIPQQYAFNNSVDSIKLQPTAIVPSHGLVAGLVWHSTIIKVNCAVLYGQDCGLLGHTADVEGFCYSLKYIGADSLGGWMYDTTMANWMGLEIQTTSHAGTPCEQVETKPYKSWLAPQGYDTILASPDKHGNYLTVGGCGQSVICNPGCGNTPHVQHTKPVNVGEPNASLAPDLGTYYPAYAGEDPWGTAKFLAGHGGDAGTIADKMMKPLELAFEYTSTLQAADICPLYTDCYGAAGSAYLDYSCIGEPYSFYGQTLTNSGVYQHTLTSTFGCDSTITLTLNFVSQLHHNYQDYFCSNGTYTFGHQQLNAPGTYYDTLTTVYGCDSFVQLSLSYFPPDVFSYTHAVCNGSSYNFNGQQLNNAGLYTDTLTNQFGCDSIVYLTLWVDTFSANDVSWNFNVDTLSSTSHVVFLTGGSPSGGTYSGPGVNGNLFFPDSAGPGTHVITYTYADTNGCGSGTATHNITVSVSGISEINSIDALRVYPVPANAEVIVELPGYDSQTVQLKIFDVQGKQYQVPYLHASYQYILQTSELPNGVYCVQLSGANTVYTGRFIKHGQ